MSTKTIATSSTARKVVGSLGVIGAAAAVAGLGTFGTFTASSSPATNTAIETGTLSINAAQPGTLPLNVANMVPGDSITRPLTITNDGNLPLSKVSVSAAVAAGTSPSILTSDAVNGLQLELRSCNVAWTQQANGTLTCSSGELTLSTGPVVRSADLPASAKSLVAKGVDHIAYTVSLPESADNTFQGKSAALTLTVTGAQKTGTNR